MLGKTHVTTGIATSLVVLHPDTMPGVISAVVGGAVGGWICDIDCRDSEVDGGDIAGFVFTGLIAGTLLFIDNLFGNGICRNVISNWGITSIIALVIFLGCCFGGFVSPHRSFSHSFLALTIMTTSVYFVATPLTMPFLVGFVSHLVLDITNKRGLYLLFPLKKKFCLGFCSANGKENDVIFGISLLIAIISAVTFSMLSVSQQYTTSDLLSTFRQSGGLLGLNYFQLYLIIINVITFFVLFIDYLICTYSDLEDDEDWGQNFIHTILDFLGIFGGAFGMLLALIIFNRGRIGKENATWFATAISLTIAWGVVYCIVCNPFGFGFGLGNIHMNIMYHLPLILYIIFVNVVSFILFFRDRNKLRPKWTFYELILLFVGIIGGTIGGLLVMIVTGKKVHSEHFSFGFPILLAAQACLVAYLLFAGIA